MAAASRRHRVTGGLFLLVLGLSATGCLRRPAPASSDVSATSGGAGEAATAISRKTSEEDSIRPLRRCFSDLPPWIDPPVADVLDQAARFLDEEDFEGVLACTEEASRASPRSVEAHHGRALAL